MHGTQLLDRQPADRVLIPNEYFSLRKNKTIALYLLSQTHPLSSRHKSVPTHNYGQEEGHGKGWRTLKARNTGKKYCKEEGDCQQGKIPNSRQTQRLGCIERREH